MKEKVMRKRTDSRSSKTSKIPEFKSRQEEAEFWDTHSITDFLDELKPVKVTFAKNLSEGITIRLDPHTMTTIRAEARAKGMGPTTLIRMWVMERMGQHKASKRNPRRKAS
jgi:predicted DNA binding CopG/RHH family protein